MSLFNEYIKFNVNGSPMILSCGRGKHGAIKKAAEWVVFSLMLNVTPAIGPPQ